MKSIAYIPASDQTGNASLMTITTIRSGGATTISVNTVANVPTKFYGSMGAPHTFTDPVTGETITVISEATAVDFAGHVDGSAIEIDEIAPGFTDNGSEVGDIIVIRPITEWANNIFNILGEAHEDDGRIKNTAIQWFDSDETWTYSSWSATTRIGEITVPSDATTKYMPGNRIKISQTTGGTKYGIIHAVAATTLTVFFPSGTVLENEDISTPQFSPLDSPIGFDKDALLWELKATLGSTQDTTSTTPTNTNMPNLPLGVGAWDIFAQGGIYTARATTTFANGNITLSAANNTSDDSEMNRYVRIQAGSSSLASEANFAMRKNVKLASPTTYYLNHWSSAVSITMRTFAGASIRAVSRYL